MENCYPLVSVNYSKDYKIVDLGGSLRMVNGHESPPSWIDYIKRDFFSEQISYDGYYIDNDYISTQWSWEDPSLEAGGLLPPNHYFYKMSAVYDGYQEGPLEKTSFSYKQVTDATGTGNNSVKITFRIDKESWNPRITGINVYRGTNSVADSEGVTYYKIKAFTTVKFSEASYGDQLWYSYGKKGYSIGYDVSTYSLATHQTYQPWNANGWQGTDMILTGINSETDFPNNPGNIDFTASPFSTVIARGNNEWMPFGYGHFDHDDRLYASNLLVNEHQSHDPSQPWYPRARQAGSFIRKIEDVDNSVIIADWDFWRDSEVPVDHSSEQEKVKGNYGFGENDTVTAIISHRNALKNSWKLNNGGWSKRVAGSDGSAIWSSSGEPDVKYDGTGTQITEGFTKVYLNCFEYITGSDWDAPSGAWQTHLHMKPLKRDTWYAVALTCQTYHDGWAGNHTMGCWITKAPSATAGGGETLVWDDWNAGTGGEYRVFHGGIPYSNSHNVAYQYIWLFKTPDASNAQWASGGPNGDGSTQWCNFFMGIKDGTSGPSNGDTCGFNMMNPAVWEVLGTGPSLNGYYGPNVTYADKDINGSGASVGGGDIININNSEYTAYQTQEIANKELIQLSDDLTSYNNIPHTLYDNPAISTTDNGDTLDISVLDTGFTDGSLHPFGDTSIRVMYKCAKMINGRLFVGNVKINAVDSDEETHPNWLLFSEFDKPDIIPITNYIVIADLGDAGEITGFGEVTSNLVVFTENAMFRLNIPSYDPTQWQLVETSKKIGCTAPSSIIEIKGVCYFASKDGLYMVDANFVPQKLSLPIDDEWKRLYNDDIEVAYQPLKERIVVLMSKQEFPAIRKVYMLDLKKPRWQEYKTYLKNYDYNPYHLANDPETKKLYTVNALDEDVEMRTVSSLDLDIDEKSVYGGLGMETGWILLSTPDKPLRINAVNMTYEYANGNTSEFNNNHLRLELFSDFLQTKKDDPFTWNGSLDNPSSGDLNRFADIHPPVTINNAKNTVVDPSYLEDPNFDHSQISENKPDNLLSGDFDPKQVSRTGQTVKFRVGKRAYAVKIKIKNYSLNSDAPLTIKSINIDYE